MILLARSAMLLVVVWAVASGCSAVPRHRLDETAQAVPQMRAFALKYLPGLTPDERQMVNSREPTVGHANYVVYYFWWYDAAGRPLVTVEATPPPCEPLGVRRSEGQLHDTGAGAERSSR